MHLLEVATELSMLLSLEQLHDLFERAFSDLLVPTCEDQFDI